MKHEQKKFRSAKSEKLTRTGSKKVRVNRKLTETSRQLKEEQNESKC